ncbi:MAG: RluA family pseudouridine synthase [Ruminococcus sp.]|nr:RluA family pseudouridine synthase [Ruminococcus sp.]
MRELRILANDAGQRLNKYLMKYLDAAPSSFVYKMLRKKNITLNGKKAAGDEILADNDIVTLFLSEETIGKFKKQTDSTGAGFDRKSRPANTKNQNFNQLAVLYKTSDILAVHKDAGVLSQKAKADDYSINEMIADYCQKEGLVPSGSTFKPSVCNRLDRNTSGIILAGISLKGSQYLSRILRTREVEKYYFAVVKGLLDQETEQKAYIKKDSDKNVSEIVSADVFEKNATINDAVIKGKTQKSYLRKKDYDYIETYFTPLSSNGTYTLLKIHLITGKSHQIRAGLRALGHPVIGDVKYGDASVNAYFRNKYGLKSQLLHAGQVILPDKTVIDDPLPKLFRDICEGEHLRYHM